MRTAKRVIGYCALILAWAVTAAADPPDPAGLRTSLTEMLSLITLGTVAVSDEPARITQAGDDFKVLLPLTGFVAPPGASAEAVARSDGKGGWDVTSIAFPLAGAVGASIDQVVSYTIGQQSIHGRLDPTLATASSLAADLRAITLHSSSGPVHTEQAVDRMTLGGRLTAKATGRLDLSGHSTAANWHGVLRDPAGQTTNTIVGHSDSKFTISDLDRARGARLLAAARSLMAATKDQDQPNGLLPVQRDALRAMLDATEDLLTRIEADNTLDSLRFDAGNGKAGTVDRVRMHMDGMAEEQRLNATVDFAMDGLSLAALSVDSAAFLPHHLAAKAMLGGVPVGPLMALLRDAISANPDSAALQSQAIALLGGHAVHVAIESIAFDAGPVHVLGSAHLQPRSNGEIGANIHISANGIAALLARAQRQPDLQNVMPLMFMAKGLGREQGDSIIWDIAVGGGPMTVNGIPFGQ